MFIRYFRRGLLAIVFTVLVFLSVSCFVSVSALASTDKSSNKIMPNEFAIFSPENFTKTKQEDIFIIGTVENKGRDILIKHNNRDAVKVLSESIKEGAFHIRIFLWLGMNLIEVKESDGNKSNSKTLLIFREPKMGTGLESALPEFKFHIPRNESKCKGCHQVDLPPEEKGEQKLSKFCLRCHSYLVSQIYVHGPIPVGGCLPCHDWDSVPNKYSLKTKGPDLCFSCHDDVKDQFNKLYHHGPAAVGMCVVCHTPHGSTEKFQLRKAEIDLCIFCHQDMNNELAKSNVHKPVADGHCTDCHSPHSSGHKFMLYDSKEKFCGLCHKVPPERHIHPVKGKPKKPMPEKAILDENGELMCMTCHEVHATNTDNLWREPEYGKCSTGCH